MIQENRLLWQETHKKSFWEEGKFVFFEKRNIAEEQGAWKKRKKFKEKPKESKDKNQADLEAFKSFDIPVAFESTERGMEQKQTLLQGTDEQMNRMEEWFVRYNILSHDEDFQERFKALKKVLDDKITDPTNVKEIEKIARRAEDAEIQRLYKELGLSRPSAYSADTDEMSTAGEGFLQLRQATDLTDKNAGKKAFKEHLQGQYTQEQTYFQDNIAKGFSTHLSAINKSMTALEKDFPDLKGEGMHAWQSIGTDLQKLQQLKSEFVTEAEQLDFAKQLSGMSEIQGYFEIERQSFLDRNGQNPEGLDRKECWQRAVKKFWEKKRDRMKFLVEKFTQESQALQWQMYCLRQFLEQNSIVTTADIKKKILPEVLLKTHIPNNSDQANPDITFDDLISQELDGEKDKVKRAIKAAKFVAGSEQWMSDKAQGGIVKACETPEEVERILAEAQAQADVKKSKENHFNGEIGKITGELNGASGIIDKIAKSYLDSQETDPETGKVTLIKNTTLTDSQKAGVQERLNEYQTQLKQLQSEANSFPQGTSNEIFADAYSAAISFKSELEAFEDKIKRTTGKNIEGVTGGVKIEFVSPESLLKAVKNIYKVFVEEVDHDNEVDAAMLQQNLGTGLSKVVPGWAGHIMDLAGKKGKLKKEGLESKERKEFDYSSMDHHGLLEAFYNWNDDNLQHLRSLLEAMKDRGFLRWDDERLWTHLEKATGIKMPEIAKTNTAIRNVYLGKIFAKLFDNENWFGGAKRGNQDNFIKKYQEKMTDAKNIDTEKGVRAKFTDILKKHYENNKEYLDENGQMSEKHPQTFLFDRGNSVDPHVYAALLIHETTENGMNGEDIIFYLIRGVASGLLSHEFITHFADKGFFNKWQDLNVFRKMSMADVRKFDKYLTGRIDENAPQFLDQKTDGDREKEVRANYREKNFFRGDMGRVLKVIHDGLSTDDGVADRTNRIIEKWREVDKDIHQNALCKVPPSQMIPLLGKYSGQTVLDKSKAQNGITGFTTRLDAFDLWNKNRYNRDPSNEAERNKKHVKSLASSMASSLLVFGAFDGRLESKDTTPLTPADWNESPAGGFDAGLKTVQYANVVQNFLATFIAAVPDQTIGKFSKEDILATLFSKNRQPDQKLSDDMIRTLSLKGELQNLIEKRSNLFLFLMDTWQNKQAFASYLDAKNSIQMNTVGDSYTNIHEDLQWTSKTAERFEKWKTSERCPAEFRKASKS